MSGALTFRQRDLPLIPLVAIAPAPAAAEQMRTRPKREVCDCGGRRGGLRWPHARGLSPRCQHYREDRHACEGDSP